MIRIEDFDLILNLSAKESFMGEDIIMKKLSAINGTCYFSCFVIEVLEVLKCSNRVCAINGNTGECNVSVTIRAKCYFIKPQDIVVIKITKNEYGRYKGIGQYVEATVTGIEKGITYKEGDVVPAIVGKALYCSNNIVVTGVIYTQSAFPVLIKKIHNVKNVPDVILKNIEELCNKIKEEVKRLPDFEKRRAKICEVKKYKTPIQSAFDIKFENVESLYLVYSQYTTPEKAQYFLVPENADLKEFEPYAIQVTGESLHYSVLSILEFSLNLVKMVNDLSK